jgi:Na+-transporting NADH:ubiquinone oxidoreductase subunit NqrE
MTVFLVAALGSSNRVADVGALGRIAVILSVLGAVINNLVIPRFARCQSLGQVVHLYRGIMILYVVLIAAFVSLGVVFPRPFLWILGSQYDHLGVELPYILFASGVSAVSGVLYGLNAARGWLQGSWLVIPVTLLSQACLIPLLDLRSIEGAVLFTALPVVPVSLLYVYRAVAEMKLMKPALGAS